MLKVPTSPNNPEIDLLSNNKFIDYLVLIFAKIKKLKYILSLIE